MLEEGHWDVRVIYSLRYKQLLQRKGDLEELEKNLKEQQEKMSAENQGHRATADQCKLLKEENDRSDCGCKCALTRTE